MPSFWFITAPLPGHLDWGGMLKTAKLLRDSRHDVLWVSQPPIAPMVEAAGIEFAAIAETGWLWPPPPMPDPRTLNPEIPEGLAKVIMKAMAKEPGDRYQSAAQMHDALAAMG